MNQKYGVWAVRSAASIYGAAQSWLKDNGQPMEFDTMGQAEEYACYLNINIATANTHYFPKMMEQALSNGADVTNMEQIKMR